MTPRTLVTGFLPFGGFSVNPSALLAESCGRRFELLEVSYDAVDGWIDRVEGVGESFHQLLMLGLRGDGSTFFLEQVARNEIGATPDVRGVVRGPGVIEPDGPAVLAGTVFGSPPLLSADGVMMSGRSAHGATSDPDTPSPLPSPGGRGRMGAGRSAGVGMPGPYLPLPPGEGRGEGVSGSEVGGFATHRPERAPVAYRTSDNAGCYLCNYVYYRALRRFPGKRVGFVHVPPLEVVPLDAQRERLAQLLSALEAE